jgi:hypothetical protein
MSGGGIQNNPQKKMRFRVFLVLSDGSSKALQTTKNVLQKNRVERFLQKIDKKIKEPIFLDFFITFWGVSR